MLGLVGFILMLVLLGWFIIGLVTVFLPIIGFIFLIFKSTKELEMNHKIKETNFVLVVDDQYHTIIPLIKIFQQASVPFKYVADGFDAIKELTQTQFKLIIIDHIMPNLNGIETLTEADQFLNDSHHTPVIFFSGSNFDEEIKCKLNHLTIVDSWDKSMNKMELNDRVNQLNLISSI